MRTISFSPKAFNDFMHCYETDKTTFSKISFLILEAARNPFSGKGKPEPLKNKLTGYWSRRINEEHRLVYKVTGNILEIVSCKYHYTK